MGRRTILIIVIVVGVLILAGAGIFFLTQQNQPQQAQPPAEGTDGQVDQGDGTVTDGTATDEDGGIIQLPIVSDGAAAEDGPRNEVVVFLQTIPRGTLITKENADQLLTFDERLVETIDNTMVMTTTEIIGRYLRTDVFQGETVTTDVLAQNLLEIAPNSFSPSSLIPTGFVGMGVPMDRLSSVAYGLETGDFVDIMISFTFSEIDPEFQTLLQNSVSFFLETVDEEGNVRIVVVVVDPFGKFEELPTGDLAVVQPGAPPQLQNVSMILQNAKVIQVGEFQPDSGVAAPTATPEVVEVEEGEEVTPTVPPAVTLTPTPAPNDVLVVALTPQQQLLLKYAVEAGADIDFALRGINDGQLYTVQNVDLNYLLERFDVQVPPNFNYTVDDPDFVTATPIPAGAEEDAAQDTTGENN